MKDKEKELTAVIETVLRETKNCDMSIETLTDYLVDRIKNKVIIEEGIILSNEEYEKLKSLYDCSQGAYMTSNIGDLPLTVEGLRKAVDEITRLNIVEAELQELNIKYYNEAKDLRRKLADAEVEKKRLTERLK